MGARVFLTEPAKIFGAVIAHDDGIRPEQMANRIIGSAALRLFRRSLLFLQQKPVKLVIFTQRRPGTNYWLRLVSRLRIAATFVPRSDGNSETKGH
jgi:hypothetical protein